jgi:hypothetical protein
LRGLEEPAHASRGLEELFFPVVLLCQFSVLAGNRFCFYILLMYLGYRTMKLWCCARFFLFWWEIVFGVSYVLSVQYSCAVVLVFWLWREIKANLVRFTLFYSTLLTLAHGQNDRQRVTYTRFVWAGGTCIFQLCCCVSFWFWREIGFGCTYYLLCTFGVPYSCGVVLVILVLAGNSFWCNIRT